MRRLLLVFLAFLAMGALEPPYDAILVRADLPLEWLISQTYSHKFGIPIVTTAPDQLDAGVKEELLGYKRFGFNRVLIVGGERAIYPSVQADLEREGFVTHRISEADRYGTSARVAVELFGQSEGAVIASGESKDYGALLAAGRLATKMGYPILFVKADEVPLSVSEALRSLRVKKAFVLDQGLADGTTDSIRSAVGEVVVVREGGDLAAAIPRDGGYKLFLVGAFAGVLIMAGILRLRKKERVPYTLLTEDEERVVRAILESGGELTQDQLPEKTDFSRPKVSRITADLVGRAIISKEPSGRTHKLVIKKDFYGAKR